MADVPARLQWAMEVLGVRPSDHLLEVGCGPGVAAALVCQRLDSGRLVAIDRSPVAVRRTLARNDAHVVSGLLEVRHAELAGLDLPPRSLDGAYAVDVNLFWVRDPQADLMVLRRALRPRAAVHVLYGADGPTASGRITAGLVGALTAGGFTDVTVLTDRRGFGVSALR